MTPIECAFESEVLAAVLETRWPDQAGGDLVAHVAHCAICSDLVTIAVAVEESREALDARPVIPDSGRVWWLAQRRARLEAAELANRPLRVARVAALACAIGLFCAYFGALSSWARAALGRMASGTGDLDIAARLASASRLLAAHSGVALAMAAVLLLVPAAVYLTIGRE